MVLILRTERGVIPFGSSVGLSPLLVRHVCPLAPKDRSLYFGQKREGQKKHARPKGRAFSMSTPQIRLIGLSP